MLFPNTALNHAELSGTVPVLIYLSKDEHASPQPPPPITLQVPRASMLLAVDPFVRSELLSPYFGANANEFLKLTHRSSFSAVASAGGGNGASSSSSGKPSPAPTTAAAKAAAALAALPSYLVWQDPIGVCVDVLSSAATDAKLYSGVEDQEKSREHISTKKGAGFVSPAMKLAGRELLMALCDELRDQTMASSSSLAKNNQNNAISVGSSLSEKGTDAVKPDASVGDRLLESEGALAVEQQQQLRRRRLRLIASLLDTAAQTYDSIRLALRVEEGIFPLKLTVSVDSEMPLNPRILWISGARKPTVTSTAAGASNRQSVALLTPATSPGATVAADDGVDANGGDGTTPTNNFSSPPSSSPPQNAPSSLSTAVLIPQPSKAALEFSMQKLKQASQLIFGTVKCVLNYPYAEVEALRRIPLVAKTYSISNAISEEQHAQLLTRSSLSSSLAASSAGAVPTPQQVLSRGVGTLDTLEAVNYGRFTNFASTLSWMCEQRSKMESLGGVCEGIPLVLHWAAETPATMPSSSSSSSSSSTASVSSSSVYSPLYASTHFTIPNPARGAPLSVAMSSLEGCSFTLGDAILYAMAQQSAKAFGCGSWLDGDRRKAGPKVALTKAAAGRAPSSSSGDGGGGGPNPLLYKSARPHPIDPRVLLSTVASLHSSSHAQESSKVSSPTITTTAKTSRDASAKLREIVPIGLQWLNEYLTDSIRLAHITTDNYLDDSVLEGRRAEALRPAVAYHKELYAKACDSIRRVRPTAAAATAPTTTRTCCTLGKAAKDAAMTNVAMGQSALSSSDAKESSVVVASFASTASDAEASQLVRSLAVVEAVALNSWKESVLDAFGTATALLGDSNSEESTNVGAGNVNSGEAKEALPPLPRVDVLFNYLLGAGSSSSLSSAVDSAATVSSTPSLSLPEIHASVPRFIVNGVEVSLATPLLWAYENMSSGDMALHMTIVMPRGLRPIM